MGYPAVRFGRSEWLAAYRSWGMNCGPGALAGVLGLLPDQAHALLPHFARKGFTTEWMMEEALRTARIPWRPDPGIWPAYGLARVLWRGPWWDDPKPFAREYHSHWVGVRGRNGSPDEIFDINAIEQGGWIPFAEWRDNLVPWLLGWDEPEATGGFEVSDAYALDPAALTPAPEKGRS